MLLNKGELFELGFEATEHKHWYRINLEDLEFLENHLVESSNYFLEVVLVEGAESIQINQENVNINTFKEPTKENVVKIFNALKAHTLPEMSIE